MTVTDGDQTPAGVSDETLLEMHLGGQKGAFEALVRRRSGELYRFLVRFTGSATLAEDVLQDAFLQVHLAAERFDLSRRFKPWLFTIAANKARDALRKRTRRSAASLDNPVGSDDGQDTSFIDLMEADVQQPLDFLENQELRRTVKELVMEMPENLREVLVLNYFHHMRYKEIAESLGVPLGTVKSRLHAAVNHFARRWQSIGKRFGND